MTRSIHNNSGQSLENVCYYLVTLVCMKSVSKKSGKNLSAFLSKSDYPKLEFCLNQQSRSADILTIFDIPIYAIKTLKPLDL